MSSQVTGNYTEEFLPGITVFCSGVPHRLPMGTRFRQAWKKAYFTSRPAWTDFCDVGIRSKEFWRLVVFRGRVLKSLVTSPGVVKTFMVELTDDTNLADALTLLVLAWDVGSTIGYISSVRFGPTLGGVLSDPADHWPYIFAHPFFRENPYFLACASAAACSFVGFVFAFYFMKETLNTRVTIPPNDSEPSERDPLLSRGEAQSSVSPKKAQPTIYEIVAPNLPLQRTLVTSAVHFFTHMSYKVLIPLVYATSIPNGGLGLSPYQIGLVLGIFGVCNGFLQLLVWKPMLKRIGPRRMFLLSYSFHIVRTLMMTLARVAAARAGRATASLAAAAYNAITTLVVKSSPPDVLGAVNGI
ncbi:hypothetical protein L218DRAFT_1077964 [Marasmius fiardii PR-910]|nr:hypothetical protein L218DRAFT_1077964 [Marasmius fiardii PR-910]